MSCATPVAYDGKPHNSLFQTWFGDEPCRAAQESHDFNRGRCQDNIWTVSALVNYEIVDNGQNIKFEINDSRYRDKVFYTSMSNVELVYRDDSVDYRTGYAVYPGDASKLGKGGK